MSTISSFKALEFPENLLSTLSDLGYEAPTPIQASSIPVLMKGADLLAQAQTGTGKTAAFALPILSQCDISLAAPQALVVAPTRELALQVAEAFGSYAKQFKGFNVTTIYGGQDYRIQLKSLKRGPQVIVGTPGRLLDQMKRENIDTTYMKTVILDEADEMLKMGFIEDIETILDFLPKNKQTGLFSATMPVAIQKITKRYLKDPEKIIIKPCQQQKKNIEQSYILVNRNQKREVLRRYLEIENIEAAMIFVRTKIATVELAEKLQTCGYAVEALNGDLNQARREKVINRFRKKQLDIVIATDVAARGIDVEHVTHVINYDIPTDEESYVHRIGRTGRAGRKGKALLLVTPREKRLLKDIERAIESQIDRVAAPSVEQLSRQRVMSMATSVKGVISKSKKLALYKELVTELIEEEALPVEDVAAALAYMLHQSNPLPTEELEVVDWDSPPPKRRRRNRGGGRHPAERRAANRERKAKDGSAKPTAGRKRKKSKQGPIGTVSRKGKKSSAKR